MDSIFSLKVAIRKELTEMLYRNLAQGLLSIFVIATVLIWQLHGVSNYYLIWYIALSLNLIIGLTQIAWYFKTRSNPKLINYHFYFYITGSTLTALLFGIIGSVLMPPDILQQVLVMIVIICIVGGAVQGVLASYVAAYAYLFSAMTPLIVWEFLQILDGRNIFIGILIATLGNFFYLIAEIKSGHEKLVTNIKLTLENMNMNKELFQQKSQIEFLSEHDTLTLLYNRRYLEETLKNFSTEASHKLVVSIFMFDIDYFKSINDTKGHDAGDAILREIGKLIKEFFNTNDLSFRYGGEEFLIILENITSEKALQFAESFRLIIKKHYFHVLNQSMQITISGGIAALHEHSEDFKEVITAADKALYKAKNSGRDQIQLANAISQKSSTLF